MWRNRNWLLHFNGASIASWLPMISLELHREDDPRWIGNDPAELHRGVRIDGFSSTCTCLYNRNLFAARGGAERPASVPSVVKMVIILVW